MLAGRRATARQKSTASRVQLGPLAPARHVPPAGPVSVSSKSLPCRSAHSATTSATITPSWSAVSRGSVPVRSEEHTSELQSRLHLVCRLLLEKKKINNHQTG